MRPFVAEMIGTMLLVILGDGVVANVLLNKSKGQNSGWIVITTGWALGVAVAVYCVGWISGGHINPAVTLGLAAIGQFPWVSVPEYIVGQIIGGFLGGVVVWLAYFPHWAVTEDKEAIRGVFCTAPAIRRAPWNLVTEIIGTFVLLVGVLAIPSVRNLIPNSGFSQGFGPFLVCVLVWAIGLSLGGPTGYAINPARDLGPRLAHFLLPIPAKIHSDWGYAWVPIVGPIIGGVAGAVFYRMFWGV
jgi:glycerol uptake facilitator protein